MLRAGTLEQPRSELSHSRRALPRSRIFAAGRHKPPTRTMCRIPRIPVLVCIERRRRAASPTPSTPYNNFPRAPPTSGPPFVDSFGRRQACAASKHNASGPRIYAVRCVDATRSGAYKFDTTYGVPASSLLTLKIWPPAGTRRLRAQCTGYSTPVRFVCSGGAAKRRRMLRHDVWISRELPFSTEIFAAGRQASGAFQLNELDIRLPCVSCAAEAPLRGAHCFDTTY
ncbi:hypothetical protein DFH06DRAFT_1235904 [Mycena polygramma]|nr:hypothetical protein DFH06DRAFT_80264 [Mycena polygramma]KAJ7619002.1 hypothetical protein DFH06DRAFT_1483047 [Mycena polygramma]KAJ7619005.1 hypothetical protein DFH06DRAFT_1235894 [Mycena polygramma]KAJ7619010.1 hypothetical protein DFH06DRAFT_1235904 [Mycena polygramma]